MNSLPECVIRVSMSALDIDEWECIFLISSRLVIWGWSNENDDAHMQITAELANNTILCFRSILILLATHREDMHQLLVTSSHPKNAAAFRPSNSNQICLRIDETTFASKNYMRDPNQITFQTTHWNMNFNKTRHKVTLSLTSYFDHEKKTVAKNANARNVSTVSRTCTSPHWSACTANQ